MLKNPLNDVNGFTAYGDDLFTIVKDNTEPLEYVLDELITEEPTFNFVDQV